MNTFKTLALVAALAAGAFTLPAFAIKTCNSDATCQSPNGPSVDGIIDGTRELPVPLSIKVCNADNSCQSPNGPDASGRKDVQLGEQIVGIELPQ